MQKSSERGSIIVGELRDLIKRRVLTINNLETLGDSTCLMVNKDFEKLECELGKAKKVVDDLAAKIQEVTGMTVNMAYNYFINAREYAQDNGKESVADILNKIDEDIPIKEPEKVTDKPEVKENTEKPGKASETGKTRRAYAAKYRKMRRKAYTEYIDSVPVYSKLPVGCKKLSAIAKDLGICYQSLHDRIVRYAPDVDLGTCRCNGNVCFDEIKVIALIEDLDKKNKGK